MNIRVNGGATEIKLTVTEQRKLNEASALLAALAKHSDGVDEKAASELLAKVAAKWIGGAA
jgi:hypothetical protein